MQIRKAVYLKHSWLNHFAAEVLTVSVGIWRNTYQLTKAFNCETLDACVQIDSEAYHLI